MWLTDDQQDKLLETGGTTIRKMKKCIDDALNSRGLTTDQIINLYGRAAKIDRMHETGRARARGILDAISHGLGVTLAEAKKTLKE